MGKKKGHIGSKSHDGSKPVKAHSKSLDEDINVSKDVKEKNPRKKNENEVDEKVVVGEKRSVEEGEAGVSSVKLVHGEDIRWAQLPINCDVHLVRDVVVDRYPSLKGVLIKYKDQEGDLVTITTTEELRAAEGLVDHQGFLRLYIAEVSPDKEPFYDGVGLAEVLGKGNENADKVAVPSTCVEDWTLEFAKMFKNYIGVDTDSYLDIHDMEMELYSEEVEETVTSEDAQKLFDLAGAKFQEMAALALFNWGNVHLSKARNRSFVTEDGSLTMSTLEQVKSAYNWAQNEYATAGMKYREALEVKPDFYEGHLSLGLQQFEQARLSWYFVIGSKSGFEIAPTSQVLELYNKAEDSMEKGLHVWEAMEERRLNGLSNPDKSADEASARAAYMKSQIYIFWGTMLYERSVVEYKLSLPSWEECLEFATEKFQLGGASSEDIAVMTKNHCSNKSALEGFKVDEIIQAWNVKYDADKWRTGVAAFRLEPLFKKRTPKLHSVPEHP